MPYLPSQARLKSDAYQKILDADIIEQDEKLRDLIAKQQVSGSVDANNPTRDEDGFLVSIEDPRNPGQAAEGITESVRIENKQQFFNDTYLGNIDQEFSHFTPPSIVDVPDDDDIVDAVEEIKETVDTGQITDPYRPIIVKFIDEVLREKSLKSSQIKSLAKVFYKGINTDGIESIDENISNEKLNALITKVIAAYPPGKKAFTAIGFIRNLKSYRIDLKIALDLRDYAVILRDFIFKNKTLRRFYKELGLPETITTQSGGQYRLNAPITQDSVAQDDLEELRGKGYIM
tara:strand:- start:73 stop:939 length:867 start_codon:yes stop_codon:yes gene_type:complete